MKAFDLQTGMEKLNVENSSSNLDVVQQKLLQRQCDLQKEFRKRKEKNEEEVSGINQIEHFLNLFTVKQNVIEEQLKVLETESLSKNDLVSQLNDLNHEIQELQNFYSNSIIFLRIYDKKKCQTVLQGLHNKLQDLETKLLPKKKFGFRSRKKIENSVIVGIKKGEDITDNISKIENIRSFESCGFQNRTDEILILQNEDIEKKDMLLANLKNCTVKLLGSPNTLHITKLESSVVFCGPVSTSVMVEKCTHSKLYLACQQLRVHETLDTEFHLHVTSKAIIEDSKNVKFGTYNFVYENLDKHFEISKLNRFINNWDQVDDFNWLASDKPSPNWLKLTEDEVIQES